MLLSVVRGLKPTHRDVLLSVVRGLLVGELVGVIDSMYCKKERLEEQNEIENSVERKKVIEKDSEHSRATTG